MDSRAGGLMDGKLAGRLDENNHTDNVYNTTTNNHTTTTTTTISTTTTTNNNNINNKTNDN